MALLEQFFALTTHGTVRTPRTMLAARDDLGPTLLSFRTRDQHHDSSYTDPQGVPVNTASVLADRKVIGLYFADEESSFLSTFLSQAYKTSVGKDLAFEVILVSSCSDEASFHRQFSKMPWLAMPHSVPKTAALKSKFHVTELPVLVLCDAAGKKIRPDGLAAVLGDPQCLSYPWSHKSATVGSETQDQPQLFGGSHLHSVKRLGLFGMATVAWGGTSLGAALVNPTAGLVALLLGLATSFSLALAALRDPGVVQTGLAIPEGADWVWSDHVAGWVSPTATLCKEAGILVKGYKPGSSTWHLFGAPVGDGNRQASLGFLILGTVTAVFDTVLFLLALLEPVLQDPQNSSQRSASSLSPPLLAVVLATAIASLLLGTELLRAIPRTRGQKQKKRVKLA